MTKMVNGKNAKVNCYFNWLHVNMDTVQNPIFSLFTFFTFLTTFFFYPFCVPFGHTIFTTTFKLLNKFNLSAQSSKLVLISIVLIKLSNGFVYFTDLWHIVIQNVHRWKCNAILERFWGSNSAFLKYTSHTTHALFTKFNYVFFVSYINLLLWSLQSFV
jgi:hypothetical protein